jgi:superfamily II DNA or RNA helicase
MRCEIVIPPLYRIKKSPVLGIIRQLSDAETTISGDVADYSAKGVRGKIIYPEADDGAEILLLEKGTRVSNRHERILQVRPQNVQTASKVDLSNGEWLRHPRLQNNPDASFLESSLKAARDSWDGSFSYTQEKGNRKGLRLPQLAAIHAVHAHWAVSTEAATIVMPTGTGKTDTMIAIFISYRCDKLLVIVPTDGLRTQIFEKFVRLGVLKDEGSPILREGALYPIVGLMRKIPKDADSLDDLFRSCHIVVTTSQIVGSCKELFAARIGQYCSHLFIDEAHHSAAPTWAAFKKHFASKSIVQFTATPFREDDKVLDGKIIFKYPLKKAQDEGYFQTIHFKKVFEFDPRKADKAMAATAVQQLKQDSKYKHILMARVDSTVRAADVFSIYQQYPEFSPVQLHTGLTARQRAEARAKILRGETRIIVCVDMLGEGFDLPELKIAAFHDIKKSLAVTLQLTGRFIRSRPDLGDATIIANVANIQVRAELRKLYAQEPDWNHLIPQLSEEIIQEQISLQEFLQDFQTFPDDIPLRNMRPAMSTVIYKTAGQKWQPENFTTAFPDVKSFERFHHDINRKQNTLIIVTARKTPVDWARTPGVSDLNWELYIVYLNEKSRLLFIHHSNNNGYFKKLATAVAGDKVELLRGQEVFRCFSGVNRLRLRSVGLSEQLGRLISYTARMGSDVEKAITGAQKQNTRKTNLFGSGYEGGSPTTCGASQKGRLWSFRTANIEAFTRWCNSVGKKLLNESLDPDEILKGTLNSEAVANRPNVVPIAADWPFAIYSRVEDDFYLEVDGCTQIHLWEADITMQDASESGVIKLAIEHDDLQIGIALDLSQSDYRFRILSGSRVVVRQNKREWLLEDFFYENPPPIWFADGSSLEGNRLTRLGRNYEPYERQKIEVWSWSGINLKTESQGITKRRDSIQFGVIQQLRKRPEFSMIFDDDNTGEAADVVAVTVHDEPIKTRRLEVEFYHCKYSKDHQPGGRVEDLYEVCGQAQKSIRWLRNSDKQVDLFTHLLRREPRTKLGKRGTRFELGDIAELTQIREKSRIYPVKLRVFIVQPGLSKQKATHSQLELLSVTENYLMETYNVEFGVIGSP